MTNTASQMDFINVDFRDELRPPQSHDDNIDISGDEFLDSVVLVRPVWSLALRYRYGGNDLERGCLRHPQHGLHTRSWIL